MWQPELVQTEGPIYEKIAAALERDIRAGVLSNGTRLPTLKELAALLRVTPGTVNRAYELAQRRGLVQGEVGRGTYVRAQEGLAELVSTPLVPAPSPPAEPMGGWLDLSIVKPNLPLQEPYVRAALLELSQSPLLSEMLDYTPDGGHPLHRQAGAAWMQAAGLAARPEQVLLTAGAQHGLWVAVNALTRAGDLVLGESLCYPGVASVVHGLGRRLRGVAMDEEGMDPASLRELCQRERPAMVICIATCQNPTTRVMSAARRSAIAALAREFDFILVDDDLYGFLAPTPLLPLASYAPERTLYLTSLSKSVSSTVRLGYLHCPPAWLAGLAASVRTSVWMVSPLAAQLATTLINSGKAQELCNAQRTEARQRQLMARELLGQFDYAALPTAYHLWLKLPEFWSGGDQFAAIARGHQLLVAGGDAFSMNGDGEGRQYVRIALMAGSREQMRFVLTKLAGLLKMPDTRWL
ncbi:aminotransferase-like domain-containing protein [Pseudoduganella chitinolytica]|uniref:PLP-dependent aminotransferase family protein n=1 Tax=Pseudoduganella chitinolytica TaxID=34070 RepID=A0ABY8BH19_9BURK|nr:PLP-dependent aminotransferase family protein [Pseudoduganella chitinolytica]WEF34251.1 PLP-dependent aminotransferase family protein [Pseudoduganella chitinolytica]